MVTGPVVATSPSHGGEAAAKHEQVGDSAGFYTKELPGRGVGVIAGRNFLPGERVFQEEAIFVSAASARDGGMNLRFHDALLEEERSRRLPPFNVDQHHSALCALRDLGPRACRERLLTKYLGPEDSLPKDSRREAAVLRFAISRGLLPQAAAAFSALEYARLRNVVRFNAFVFNGDLSEGEPGYDIGVALFDWVSRFNHSCEPNLDFDLSHSETLGTVCNCLTARREISMGEELTISYVNGYKLPSEKRRQKLKQFWCFECDCPCCVAETGEAALVKPADTVEPAIAEGGSSDSESFETGICWDDC